MKNLNMVDWFSLVTLIIGGLNWGVFGFFRYDLISIIFGRAASIGYIIFGIAALYVAILCPVLVRKNIIHHRRISQEPI